MHINWHPWMRLIWKSSFLNSLLKVQCWSFDTFHCNFKLTLVRFHYFSKHFLLLEPNTYTCIGQAQSKDSVLSSLEIKDPIFKLNLAFGSLIPLINLVNDFFSYLSTQEKETQGIEQKNPCKFLEVKVNNPCIIAIYCQFLSDIVRHLRTLAGSKVHKLKFMFNN